MTTDLSYYVYALKDPRTSPAAPFYIGKGIGTRSHDHLRRPDSTPKGQRIREILAAGAEVLVVRLVEGLIRTPIEWAAKPVQSERMREGEKRVPDVEPAIR